MVAPNNCEICGKSDHEALGCPKRHGDSTTKVYKVCGVCGRAGHDAKKGNKCKNVDPLRLDEFTRTRKEAWEKKQPATVQQPPQQSPSSNPSTAPQINAPGPTKATAEPDPSPAQKQREELKILIKESPQAQYPYPEKLVGRVPVPAGADKGTVWTNHFVVTVSKDTLFKYRIKVGKIPHPDGDYPKKRETKKAMIQSLMAKHWPVGVDWVSDFDEIVISKQRLFDIVVVDSEEVKSKSFDHERDDDKKVPGKKAKIVSMVTFEGEVSMQPLQNYIDNAASPDPYLGRFKKAAEVLSILNIVSCWNIHTNDEISRVGKKFYMKEPKDQPENRPIDGDKREKKEDKDKYKFLNGINFSLDDIFRAQLGFYTSMRIGGGKILLNVNTATSVFFEELNLAEWIAKDKNRWLWEKRPKLKGARVTVPGEKYSRVVYEFAKTCDELTVKRYPGATKAANDQQDRLVKTGKAEEMETIKEHMKARDKRWNAGFEGSVCVNVGNHDYPDWYSTKVVKINPFNPYREMFSSQKMVSGAERSQQNNKTLIEGKGLSALGLERGWRNLGIESISNEFLPCDALLLKIPSIQYQGAELDLSKFGVKWALKKVRYPGNDCHRLNVIYVDFKPSGFPNIKIDIGNEKFQFGLKELGKTLRLKGINVDAKDALVQYVNVANLDSSLECRKDMVKSLNGAHKALLQKHEDATGPLRLLLIVVRERNLDVYSHIKWWGDCVVGIPTVCVQKENLASSQNWKKGPDNSTLENICLKFNYRLSGTNHTVKPEWSKKFDDTMIIGADVTHPGQGNDSPSLAAVVSTYTTDPKNSAHYLGSARLQKSRMEYIQELKEMVMERLKVWKSKNGKKPANILFYRDGVSETQFEMVKNLECQQIREAYNEVAGPGASKVNITLLVVGKRHHTRFFKTGKQLPEVKTVADRKDRNNPDRNFPSGLVVDSGVVDTNHFSFYLQSHNSPLGTAKNAHYFVIVNDMKLEASDLETFTFNLCYTSARALMPLSVCPPARYADILCDRLRCYMRPALQKKKEQPSKNKKPTPLGQRDEQYVYHSKTKKWEQIRNDEDQLKRFRDNHHLWIPASTDSTITRSTYGPWGESMDGIMFYL